MSDCERFLELVDQYVDGELNQDQIKEVEAHIAVCEDCGLLVDMTRMLRESSSLLAIDPPPGFSAGVMEKVRSGVLPKPKPKRSLRFTLVAACAALAIIVYSSGIPGLNNAKEGTTGSTMMDQASQADMAEAPQMAGKAGAQTFAAPAESAPEGDAAAEDGAGAQRSIEDQFSVQPFFSMGGADTGGGGEGLQDDLTGAPESSALMMTPQLLEVQFSEEDAPLIENKEFARGYSVIMTAKMPAETIESLSFESVKIDETYYIALANDQVETFFSELRDEELTITVHTKGTFVISEKTEALAMLTVVE